MRYDVVVVGAGPAGATAAKVLSESGIHTLLLDKASFPRDKPCGGGLPLRTVKRFKYLEENNLIESYSYGIHVHNKTLEHHVEVCKTEPCLAMVRRKKFDQGLVSLATNSGASLASGKTVTTFKRNAGNITVFLSDGSTIETQLIIGADGIWSTIAKTLGFKPDNKEIGVCVFDEYQMKPELLDRFYREQRITHIHLQPFGLAGYGWVFPKKEHVNIGVVEFRQAIDPATEKKNLRNNFREYLAMLRKQDLIPQEFTDANARGGAFPTHVVKSLVMDQVMLCGDAAGLVNPIDGEGIYNAMCSGEIAARAGVSALEKGLTHAAALSHYQKQWDHDFQRNLSNFHWLSKRWNRNIDRIFRLMIKDPQLIDFAYAAMTNEGGVQKEKWRIARRFLITYMKERLRLSS